MQYYESQSILNQYLLLHYGSYEASTEHSILPKEAAFFPKRCATWLMEVAKNRGLSLNRALDLGCAVGGASFELAKQFNEVIGIDLSQHFIETANHIKTHGSLTYQKKEEGHLLSDIHVELDNEINRERIHFSQGDACQLSQSLGQFEVILLANLLCRLPHPAACLSQLKNFLKPNGLVLITTPCSWLDSFTSPELWLGGKNNQKTIDGLHQLLGAHFDLLDEKNLPLFIREHARKYEFIVTQGTLWQLK